jgi:hypothetical protein
LAARQMSVTVRVAAGAGGAETEAMERSLGAVRIRTYDSTK